MKRIGLTGGIASGKSTVAGWIAARGVPILDADQLSRDLTRPGMPALERIAAAWPHVVRTGELDRPSLARVVFGDPKARARLEAMLIPAIVEAFESWAECQARAGHPVCVFDAALLFEQRLESRFDGVLLVAAPEDLQLERLMSRDAFSRIEAQRRLAAQLPLALKRPRARWILENDSSIDALRERFETLWPAMVAAVAPAP